MNLIMAATAMGYASVWLTSWAAYDADALDVLGLREAVLLTLDVA
jgi:nitroreductase